MEKTETLIFLIIVGILSTVFGKGRVSGNQTKRKSFLPGAFEETKTLINKQKQYTSPQAVTPIQKIEKTIETEFLHVRDTGDALSPLRFPEKDITEQQKEIGNEEHEHLKTEMVLNGVVWAEILGEPRSKKPYFSRKS